MHKHTHTHTLVHSGPAAPNAPPCVCVAQALAIYQELLQQADPDPLHHTYAAACCYCMGAFEQAEEAVLKVCVCVRARMCCRKPASEVSCMQWCLPAWPCHQRGNKASTYP